MQSSLVELNIISGRFTIMPQFKFETIVWAANTQCKLTGVISAPDRKSVLLVLLKYSLGNTKTKITRI